MSKQPPFVPRPYQHLIIDHILATPKCAVWAGMGMGKSSSTLSALSTLLVVDEGPVLIVAPLRVARSTWPDEARKWSTFHHMRVVPVIGGLAERTRALRVPADIYTTNFENLPWLVEHFGERWPFRIVIIDEATKLKGFRLRQGTQRAKALSKVIHKIRRLVELSGTPAPNGLADLWGQMWFIDQGVRLGRTYDAFRQRWFEKSYDGFSISPKDHAQAQIQGALKDVCLTVEAKDWFDLKEPIVTNLYVDLPAKARALYEDMEKRMFMELEEHAVEAFGAAARTVKCLQIANGAAYVGESGTEWAPIHDAKLEALEEVLEESGGMPLLVAYNFKSDLVRLQRKFPQGRVLDAHPQTIVDWNAGKIPMLFAHPASAGHGLNLQDGGNILVFFGHDWNLENRLQIIERIGPTRQMQAGHDRAVFIYNILARRTVDEMVLQRIETKREIQDILLEAMKIRNGK
jgi:SNF2 family DNA or RNA helicase